MPLKRGNSKGAVSSNISISSFINEKTEIQNIDYYYSNPIARSSKTMNDCREIAKQSMFNKINKAS